MTHCGPAHEAVMKPGRGGPGRARLGAVRQLPRRSHARPTMSELDNYDRNLIVLLGEQWAATHSFFSEEIIRPSPAPGAKLGGKPTNEIVTIGLGEL